MKSFLFLCFFFASCFSEKCQKPEMCALMLCQIPLCKEGEIIYSDPCQCCPYCVPKPKGEEGENCKRNCDCGTGLKCSNYTNVCVNQSCDDGPCRVKCAVVDKCEPGYYKQYFACGCCSFCTKYLDKCNYCGEGKCQPGLTCSSETKVCEPCQCDERFCETVRCAPIGNCSLGVILPMDPKKCRCCEICPVA